MDWYKLLAHAGEGTNARALLSYLVDNPGASISDAARALGMPTGSATSIVSRTRKKAAKKRPDMHLVQDDGAIQDNGFQIARHSQYYDKDGVPRGRWVVQRKDSESPETILDAFQAAIDNRGIEPLPAIRPGETLNSATDKLAVFPIGDAHVGMVACKLMSGEDWDTAKALDTMRAAIDHLVSVMPPAEVALLMPMGDGLHSDNMLCITLRSGHHLDADPRWQRVAMLMVDAMAYCCERLAARYPRVIFRSCVGNHDDHFAWMLALCMNQRFHASEHVEVVMDPSAFWHMEWGQNLIMSTHGNTKMQHLPGVMVADWPEAVGRTRFRHWYVGHYHHKELKEREFGTCTVELLRTLAAKDNYAHYNGYRALRTMVADVWHKTQGHKLRHTIGVESL